MIRESVSRQPAQFLVPGKATQRVISPDAYRPGAPASAPLFYSPKLVMPPDLPDPVDGPQDKGENFGGTPNLGVVTPGIYRGAQPDQAGFQELKAGGVKNIVDLRGGHTDVPDLQTLEIGYLNIPVKSWPPEENQVLDYLKFATDPKNQPLFVHCAVGKDRTGLMTAAYRIVVQNWSKEKALAEMQAYGFHDINLEIKQYLDKMDPDEVRAKLIDWPEPKPTIIH